VSTWDYFGLTLFYASRVLVGTGRACYETLRPLAYSLLAELIHHVRLDLTLTQLSKIVYLFSRNVHDSSLPLSVQTTCVRLMLNLVETIFGRRVDHSSKEEGRALLVKPTHMGPIIFLLYFGMISSIGLSVVTFYCKALRLVAVITVFISTDVMTVHTNGNCLPLQGRILDAFVSKFGTLKHSIPQVLSSAIDISRLVPMRTNFSRQVGSSFIAVALY
jgi:hypothetical protein